MSIQDKIDNANPTNWPAEGLSREEIKEIMDNAVATARTWLYMIEELEDLRKDVDYYMHTASFNDEDFNAIDNIMKNHIKNIKRRMTILKEKYFKTLDRIELDDNEKLILSQAYGIFVKVLSKVAECNDNNICLSRSFESLGDFIKQFQYNCFGMFDMPKSELESIGSCGPNKTCDNTSFWTPVKSYKDIPKKAGLDILASCELEGDYWVIRTQYEKGKWNDTDITYANAYFIIPERTWKID